jgi:hypothetical protein
MEGRKPVRHRFVRAAPGDRELSDTGWTQVAGLVMERTGTAANDQYHRTEPPRCRKPSPDRARLARLLCWPRRQGG